MSDRDALIVKMFNDGESYDTIAYRLGVTRNVVAGVCHRMKLKRNPDRPRRNPEREKDQQDLDILSDLIEGHGEASTARHYGVSTRHVRSLRKAWREAA